MRIPDVPGWSPLVAFLLLVAIGSESVIGKAIILLLFGALALFAILAFFRWLLVDWTGLVRPSPPPRAAPPQRPPERPSLTDEEYVERRAWR